MIGLGNLVLKVLTSQSKGTAVSLAIQEINQNRF